MNLQLTIKTSLIENFSTFFQTKSHSLYFNEVWLNRIKKFKKFIKKYILKKIMIYLGRNNNELELKGWYKKGV